VDSNRSPASPPLDPTNPFLHHRIIRTTMPLDPLLHLLCRRARLSHPELAELLAMTPGAVSAAIAGWEAAFIEVKVTPERGGGFDRLAMRISRFDQVVSCYLASGGYDLMVVVEGGDLREVARFVSEKLSTLEGVISTATHFRLKTYKENGFLFARETNSERLSVSP
jgi:uncharacterized protein with GYD domain